MSPTRKPRAAPKKKPTKPRRKAAPAAPAPEASPPVEAAPPPAPEPAPAPGPVVVPEVEAPMAIANDAEPTFAARVSPIPERSRPERRRAVFFDVENTSRASRVTEALDALALNYADAVTDLIASGNWRVIGNETARILARRGAHLIHSAPATGVRDWSDLRIAVAAGVWLASARPGDRIDIVSDDRAFDAVGDVAATLGVEYHRHSYRDAARRAAPPEPRAESARPPRPPRGRGGRGGRGGQPRPPAPPPPMPVEAPAAAPVAPSPEGLPSTLPGVEPLAEAPLAGAPISEVPAAPRSDAPQSAPKEDLLQVVGELLTASPRGVTLDALAKRLKQLGFERPPGSPRLVTRVRSLRELSVTPSGLILWAGAAAPASDAPPSPPGAPGQHNSGGRRRRRGGRGRGPRHGGAPPAAE